MTDTVTLPARALVVDEPGEIRLAFRSDSGTVDVGMSPMQALAIADDLIAAAGKRLGPVRCRRCGRFLPPPGHAEAAEATPSAAVPASAPGQGRDEISPTGQRFRRKTLR